jgi:elongation factor P
MQYSYLDGDMYVFMDTSTWEQTNVPGDLVGDSRDFLVEGQDVVLAFHEGTVLFVELPPSVILTIANTEPGLQGDRSSGGTKPATLETGREIQVPLFLETGTKVKVDTETGKYKERA